MSLLGREHEAHVLVAVVLVEPVLAALVERHALALERAAPGLLRLFLAGRLELRERGAARLDHALGRDACERGGNLGSHVLGADQHGNRVFLAAQFLLAAGGVEAVGVEVIALGGVLRDAVLGAMMVGQDQTVAGDERTGAAAVEPDRGERARARARRSRASRRTAAGWRRSAGCRRSTCPRRPPPAGRQARRAPQSVPASFGTPEDAEGRRPRRSAHGNGWNAPRDRAIHASARGSIDSSCRVTFGGGRLEAGRFRSCCCEPGQLARSGSNCSVRSAVAAIGCASR